MSISRFNGLIGENTDNFFTLVSASIWHRRYSCGLVHVDELKEDCNQWGLCCRLSSCHLEPRSRVLWVDSLMSQGVTLPYIRGDIRHYPRPWRVLVSSGLGRSESGTRVTGGGIQPSLALNEPGRQLTGGRWQANYHTLNSNIPPTHSQNKKRSSKHRLLTTLTQPFW